MRGKLIELGARKKKNKKKLTELLRLVAGLERAHKLSFHSCSSKPYAETGGLICYLNWIFK